MEVFVLRKSKMYEMKILQKKLSHCKVYKSQYLLIIVLLDAIKESYMYTIDLCYTSFLLPILN